eukprot:1800327-Rhodomonas_salina.1
MLLQGSQEHIQHLIGRYCTLPISYAPPPYPPTRPIPMILCRPYAVSGTAIRDGMRYAIVLRACYAVSGTEIGYVATRISRHEEAGRSILHTCYAMSGTDIDYAATALRDVRY